MIDTAVILAGGKSKRMGKDKKYLTVNSETFIEKIYVVLSACFEKVFVSVNRKDENMVYEQIEDIVEGGVLGGIYSSLVKLKQPAFFVAVDMPFINKKIIDRFISFYDEADVMLPENRGRLEPLFGVYSERITPFAKEQLEQGDYRIIDLFDKISVKIIPGKRFEDIDKDMFFLNNINDKKSYEKYVKGEEN